MSASRVAIRYARALIDVLGEKNSLEEAQAFLDFCDMVVGHQELCALFANVTASPEDKQKVALALAAKASLGEVSTRFLATVAANGRLNLLKEIREAVARQRDIHMKIQAITLTCAAAPSSDELAAFKAGMEKTLGCQVRVEAREDASILGGAIARVGSTIYDGSISGQLDRLRRDLVKEND